MSIVIIIIVIMIMIMIIIQLTMMIKYDGPCHIGERPPKREADGKVEAR